jgi:PAS domain S-box-containing protein
MPDALVVVDHAGVIRSVNHQTELLFGYERGDLIGAALEILVPESLRSAHQVHRKDYVAAPFTRTMGQDLELHGRRRDGTQFPLDISLSHTDTEDGPLVIAAVRDITGRKKAEEAHQKSERLAAIVQHSNDAIIAKTLDGIVTSWNPAAEKMYGYRSQEMVGASIDRLSLQGRTDEITAILARVKAGLEVSPFETLRARKDGTVFPVLLTVSPIRDPQGAVVGASTTARDRTEQVKARKALAEASRQYRLLAENATDVVTMSGPDRRAIWVSPSVTRTLGWAPEELVGTVLSDLVHPDDKNATFATRDTLFAGQQATSPNGGFVMRMRRKTGDYRWVAVLATPVTDESGAPAGAVGGIRDVDDLVHAREDAQGLSTALQTSNDSLRDFVAVASHDLRSPLVTISGFTKILTDNWATLSDEARLKQLGAIGRGVDRLSRLTNDLLTSAKVEAEAEQTQPEHLRLAAALASHLEADREELGAVAVACPAELVAVVDPSHLTRILDNYLTNAFKYGDPPISIEAERVGDFVELRVRDHGPGVPPEFVPRLFTKFDRAVTSTTRATPGTGLGLSIVKTLAEANHGDARYQQDEPGGGCFVVRLPTAAA